MSAKRLESCGGHPQRKTRFPLSMPAGIPTFGVSVSLQPASMLAVCVIATLALSAAPAFAQEDAVTTEAASGDPKAEGPAAATEGAAPTEGATPTEGAATEGAVTTEGAAATDGAAATEVTTPTATGVDAAPNTAEAGAPVAGSMQTADQEYDLRLRELEGKINDLKDSIFRSKAKLTLLTEQVTGGLGGGSGAIILHKNDMGGKYLLTEAHYFLDGQELWQEVDDTGKRLTERLEYSVFEGNIVEGSHTLTVNVRIQGNGSGIFSYMSGYTWNLKDSYTFTAAPGKKVKITTSVWESGNFTTEINDRPKIRFETEVTTQEKSKGKK